MNEVFAAFGIQWQLLLAQAVNFGIVLVALTYFLYKPVLKLLASRQDAITQGIKNAEAAAAARKDIEEKRVGILSVAESEAEEIIGRATDAGKREREALVRGGEGRAEALLRGAEAQAKELKRRALAESEKDIAKTAILAAEKIIRESARVAR